MKNSLFCLFIVITVCLPAPCFGWAQEYSASEPIGIVSGWPAGLREMADSPLRTAGLFVNFNFEFFYQGTTDQLNTFLKQHSQLKQTALWVTLHHDAKRRSLLWNSKLSEEKYADFDWKLTILHRGGFDAVFDTIPADQGHIVAVDIWLDKGIDQDSLAIPANIPQKPSITEMPQHCIEQGKRIAQNQIVPGNTAFAIDLYGQLKKQQDNVFFSPYSISTALAMTYAGAENNTAEQMAQTLHFKRPAADFHPAFGQLIKQLNQQGQGDNYQLSIANALWGQKDFPFLDSFIDLNKACYNAGLENVDFIHQAEQTRQTINAWVEDKTQNKIKDLIPPGTLNEATRLVLTNAIYFKGDWALPFKPAQTKDKPFYVTPDSPVTVPLMYQKEEFKYAQLETLQLLELPYKGDALSMLVLLPSEDRTIAQLEQELTGEKLTQWQKKLRKKEVMVYLPRFKMTCQYDLVGTLTDMGMPLAFTPKADFSGMTGDRSLFISDVIHKAFVEVNEKGTEAAAATGIAMRLTAMPAPPAIFRADRPFIFIIKDNQTDSLLFIGRLADPTQNQ